MNIRDSLTGRYISPEEANKLTPERYEVEADTVGIAETLKEIFDELQMEADKLPNALFVNLEDIKAVFARHGLKI
jgi:hypothetical protein